MAAALASGCDSPDLGLATRIDAPMILATRSVPAEARPGEALQREYLIVDQNGEALALEPKLATCTLPRRLGERGYVSQACLRGFGLIPQSPQGALWDQACSIFGPTPPPVEDDEQGLRPSDPDKSGGYYVPERVAVEIQGQTLSSFLLLRSRCDLVGATRDVFDAYRKSYRENQHPDLSTAQVWINGQPGWMQKINPGSTLTIELAVPAEQSEAYPIYNQIYNRLDPGQEQLTLRAYISRGELLPSAQALNAAQLQQGQRYRFSLRTEPTFRSAILWWVLEDERGGRSWRSLRIEATR